MSVLLEIWAGLPVSCEKRKVRHMSQLPWLRASKRLFPLAFSLFFFCLLMSFGTEVLLVEFNPKVSLRSWFLQSLQHSSSVPSTFVTLFFTVRQTENLLVLFNPGIELVCCFQGGLSQGLQSLSLHFLCMPQFSFFLWILKPWLESLEFVCQSIQSHRVSSRLNKQEDQRKGWKVQKDG